MRRTDARQTGSAGQIKTDARQTGSAGQIKTDARQTGSAGQIRTDARHAGSAGAKKKSNKKPNGKVSGRVAALLIAAAVMLGMGGITTTRAALNIQSEYYVAQFYLNHLQVHLLENGRDVCGGHNTLDGESKVTGKLLQYLDYDRNDGAGSETLGKVEPGMAYKEEIAAQNGQDIPEYLRLTIRKYWMETEKQDDGTRVPVKKSVALSPGLIHLQYRDGGTVKPYNDSAWQINDQETTTESSTYYYRTSVDANAVTAPLFNELVIDGSVAELGETTSEKDPGGKTIFRYEYKYEGSAFYVEADVQAIQIHNADDAIHSQWGVYNVHAADGSLSVSN